MKNIYEILASTGMDIPEDKRADFESAVNENYKTRADYDKQVAKKDELKASLDSLQAQLDAFKDVDVDDLKEQIATLTTRLSEETQARAKDAEKAELEKRVSEYLGSKKFVNSITENSIRDAIMAELEKETSKGMSIDDVFKAVTTDENGDEIENILVSEESPNTAKFTQPVGGKKGADGGNVSLKGMSIEDRTKLKRENPELYKQLRNK